MKNNIEFYQHYANSDQHPKFKMLRTQYGWEGEGKFWALNNRIAQAENCSLDLNKKYIKASISSDLDFKMKDFDDFINHLLIECELIKEIEPGIITTDRIQETFTQVQGNREKARERKQRNLEKVLKGLAEQKKSSGEPNNRSKVKESKEDIYKNLLAYLKEKIPEELKPSEESLLEFYKYRMQDKIKGKKQPYETTAGIDGLFRDLKNCLDAGYDIPNCCIIAKQNGWLTPRESYFINIKLEPLNGKQLSKEDILKKYGVT